MNRSSNVISISSFDRSQRCGAAVSNPEPSGFRLPDGSDQSPPSAFRKLLNFFSGRLGGKAMIAHDVRNNSRLIALPPGSSPASAFGSFQGFSEDNPLCFDRSTGALRGSASRVPQVCGKADVRQQFDLAGMVGWLRQHHTQSVGFNVEALTGIPSATVENWLIQRSQPSAAHFAALIHAYGPSLLEACMRRAPTWVGAAAAADRKRKLDEDIARLTRERAALEANCP